jgi:HAMP domain-containing protein
MGLYDAVTDINHLAQNMVASFVDRKTMIEDLQRENLRRVKEVNDLLKGFQTEHSERKAEVTQSLESFTKGLHKEVNKLKESFRKEMEGFRRENRERRDEVGELVAAVKEMRSSVARARGGARRVSTHSLAEIGSKKRARRAKGK